MADTTSDKAHINKISVLRYVNKTGKPSERHLDIRETDDKTGFGQVQDILSAIEQHVLNTDELCFSRTICSSYV